MALSLIASYQLKSTAAGTTALVTPAFTPATGEVVTVTWETFDPAITLTITNSGSQTISQKILEQPGGFNGTAGINAGTIAGSPGSMTVTGTPTASARYSMTVERWAGAQLAATPVTNGATATTGAAQSTLTPTGGAGGVIVWSSQDSQSVDPSTRAYAGSGTDDGIRDDHVGSNAVGYHGYQTITGNTSQTYGLTAPTGQKWVIAGLEVQPATGATLVYRPPFAARRRLQLPPRRRVAVSAARTQVVPAPGAVPQQIRQPRRLRGLLPRRARVFAVVPAQIIAQQPAFVPSATRSRVKTVLRTLRGRGAALIPAQTPPAQSSGRPRLRLARQFRASGTQTPAAQPIVTAPAYIPPALRARTRLLRLGRGRIAAATSPQALAPTAPVYVPPGVRSRAKFGRLFRPRIAAVVPAQAVAPSPPAYVPPVVRARVRLLRWFRAASTQTPAGPALAPQATRIRSRLSRLVRGRTAPVIPAQPVAVAPAYVPPPVRGRTRALNTHRTRGAQIIPPQVLPAPPPPYVAPSVRGLRRGLKLFRPRAFQVPANGQAAPIPPIPPAPVIPSNGWNGLLGIMRSIRTERADILHQPPRDCPNDGTPLQSTPDGLLYCSWDLWMPEDQIVPDRRGLAGDWGGLRTIQDGARREWMIDEELPILACPNDGEPLRTAQNGQRYCPWDLYMPPKDR